MDLEAQFWDIAKGTAARAGLGIAPFCERDLRALIHEVVVARLSTVSDPELGSARAGLVELVERMIGLALGRGYAELHEDTLYDARQRCGIVFWCK